MDTPAGRPNSLPAMPPDPTPTVGEAGSVRPGFDFLQPPSRADSLGRLGHYEVLEVLGRGGFGIVFRALDDVLQRVVALKVLSPETSASPAARQRFLREARAAAQVRHGNVVWIYAVEEEPLPYLVMEFVPGQTLQQRLDQVGPLDAAEVVAIGREMAEGLAAAHAAGLIHRDVKPANVLLQSPSPPTPLPQGARGASARLRVRITDFGLARAADDAGITQSGMVVGTPMYMSPEQARGEQLDHRSDLFSLGSVLYTIAAGVPPFRAGNSLAVLKRVAEEEPQPIPEIVPQMPAWLCRVIGKLMAKDPDRRFQTAVELSAALEAGLTTSETVAIAVRRPGARRAAVGRRKLLLAGGALVLVALVSVTAYLLTRSGPNGPQPPPEDPAAGSGPLDALRREDIAPELLALTGDDKQTPPELVAVLGDNGRAFRYTGTRVGAIRPDGAVFAGAVMMGGWVVFWDVATGKPLGAPLAVPPKYLTALAYSHDGKRLATGGFDGTVTLWDAETRTQLRSYKLDHFPHALAFSKDGKWLAAGWTKKDQDPWGGWVKIWDARKLDEARSIAATTPGPGTDLHGLAFSPDGSRLAVGAITGEIRLWDPATGREIGAPRYNRFGGIYALAFSPDGKQLAAATSTAGVSLWEPEKVQPEKRLPLGGWTFSVAYSPDGKWLAWGTREGEVYLRDEQTQDARRVLSCRGEARVLTFTPDSKSLIAGGWDDPRPPRVWDTQTRTERPWFQLPEGSDPALGGHTKPICGVAFSPDRTLLASGSDDGTVKVWDLATRAVRHTLASGPTLSFSPDGRTLAASSYPKDVKLWDVATGKEKQSLHGHGDKVFSLAFSPDGRLLASGSRDRTVRLWPLDTDRPGRTLGIFPDVATCVAFSPDGAVVAAGSRDGTIRRWNVYDGEELALLRNPTGNPIRSLAFRPDGKTLVTGDEAFRIDEWDLTRRQVTQGVAHGSGPAGTGVIGLAWSQDGRRLASFAIDETVRLWDWTAAPQCRVWKMPPGDERDPHAIALTPDGRYLAVASAKFIKILRLSDSPP